MSETNNNPYIEYQAGDLITAESTNEMQVLIKQDIASRVGGVQESLAEFKNSAINATTFDGKTSTQWKEELDDRYIKKSDVSGSLGLYQRYFKQVKSANNTFVIEHNMGRYPVIDLYELGSFGTLEDGMIAGGSSKEGNGGGASASNLRFFVYYAGRRDPAAEMMVTETVDRFYWGDALSDILERLGLIVQPTQLFDDVLNDMWGNFFDPGFLSDNFDRIKYGHSAYIDEAMLDSTVDDLRKAGRWDDLRLATRPHQIAAPVLGDEVHVEAFHIHQNATEFQVMRAGDAADADLMVILRT